MRLLVRYFEISMTDRNKKRGLVLDDNDKLLLLC